MPISDMSSSRTGKPSTSLYVRGVPEQTRNDELKEIFGKYGPIKDVYIPLDYYTRAPRGFAYVQFEDIEDAKDAMDGLDSVRLHGRTLEIEFAQGDRKTPNDMKGKERRGGGGRYGSERYGGRRYSRSRSRSRDRNRRRSRSGERYRDRDRSEERYRERDRSEDRYRDKERYGDRRRSRSRSRSREYERSRSRSPRRTSTRHSPDRRNGRSSPYR
ncbi:serine/arginine-rich splicing factor 10-like [Paramacrobiotus metropolitanus]|uniref:serine/arginine-rich splicing factor 10-like n=1 Tax=Paramacrobiotus metropolitanus TaxID=2943436 RepID=UPI0024461229|nr:serine/arginine-rich splicing factor 10-like [Paramacrobiotus metropolitanus]